MRNINVNRLKLIGILELNRTKHIVEYKKALTGYKKAALLRYKHMINTLKTEDVVIRHFELPEPINAEKEYDRIIGMLKLDVEENVELSEQEFLYYIQDEWGWKRQLSTLSLSGNIGIGATSPDQNLFVNSFYASM